MAKSLSLLDLYEIFEGSFKSRDLGGRGVIIPVLGLAETIILAECRWDVYRVGALDTDRFERVM